MTLLKNLFRKRDNSQMYELTEQMYQIDPERCFEAIAALIEYASSNSPIAQIKSSQNANERTIAITTDAIHTPSGKTIRNYAIACLIQHKNTTIHGAKSITFDIQGQSKVGVNPAELLLIGERFKVV